MRITPVKPEGAALHGYLTSLVRHPDSVEVRVGFVRSEAAELVFEAQFTNFSDHPVEVAPETFYYLMLPTDTLAEAALAQGIWQTRVYALNPGVLLQKAEAKLDKAASKASNVSWFEVLTTATHVAEDIASIKKEETDAQIAERDERHQSDNAFFEEQRTQHAEQADHLYSQQANLNSVLLRRITLQPNQRVTGQIYFPRRDYAKRLRLVMFFDERPVQVDFVQVPVVY